MPPKIPSAIIDRPRETDSLPYKHTFLPYAYGTTISLITRVAEDVDPYNANELYLPTEPPSHKLPSAHAPLSPSHRLIRQNNQETLNRFVPFERK